MSKINYVYIVVICLICACMTAKNMALTVFTFLFAATKDLLDRETGVGVVFEPASYM